MEKFVCPWYIGYLLANPLRKLYQNPENILGSYLKPGMKVLEVGPGMGFFTLPLARLVGDTGRVYAVDLQKRMLQNLQRRASKAELLGRIETRLCSGSSLKINDLTGLIDFVLAFAVIHEVPDQQHLLQEMYNSLKKDGILLIVEPNGHVTKEEFEITLSMAQKLELKRMEPINIRGSRSAVLQKT